MEELSHYLFCNKCGMFVNNLLFKSQLELEKEKKKLARKKARERLQNQNRNLGDIVKDAEKRQAAYDRKVFNCLPLS